MRFVKNIFWKVEVPSEAFVPKRIAIQLSFLDEEHYDLALRSWQQSVLTEDQSLLHYFKHFTSRINPSLIMITYYFVGTVEKETTVLPTDGITQSGKRDQNPLGNDMS